MKVSCRCCHNVMLKDNAIRVPGEKYITYYCSKRCFAKNLIAHSKGAIADLNLSDEQIDKILDIVMGVV